MGEMSAYTKNISERTHRMCVTGVASEKGKQVVRTQRQEGDLILTKNLLDLLNLLNLYCVT